MIVLSTLDYELRTCLGASPFQPLLTERGLCDLQAFHPNWKTSLRLAIGRANTQLKKEAGASSHHVLSFNNRGIPGGYLAARNL